MDRYRVDMSAMDVPETAKPDAAVVDRLRAAERKIDVVHVLVLCVCAAIWLAVFAHYVSR